MGVSNCENKNSQCAWFPSDLKGQKKLDKLMNIKQDFRVSFFFFYVTLIIRFTKVYYW